MVRRRGDPESGRAASLWAWAVDLVLHGHVSVDVEGEPRPCVHEILNQAVLLERPRDAVVVVRSLTELPSRLPELYAGAEGVAGPA